jgi:hypothetical protein
LTRTDLQELFRRAKKPVALFVDVTRTTSIRRH